MERLKNLISITSIPIGILTLSVLGARLQSPPILYCMLALIAISFILGASNLYNEKGHQLLIFSIGLSLLYMTTLQTDYLVGTDNHGEIFYATQFLQTGVWDPTVPWAYNAALSTTILGPVIALLTSIPLEWVFKVIYPVFLAIGPVLLYSLFTKFLTKKISFLSVAFLLSIVTWQLELSGISKQMVGELILIYTLVLMITLRGSVGKLISIVGLGLICLVSHYSMCLVLLLLLIASIPFQVVLAILKERVQIILTLISFTIILTASVIYMGTVAQGVLLKSLVITAGLQTVAIEEVYPENPNIGGSIDKPKEVPPPLVPNVLPPSKPIRDYLYKHSGLVQGALGLDWFLTDSWGKVFRILQWLTQILIVIGCLYLIKERKRFPPMYLALAGASSCIIGAMVLLPGFSPIMNATRFYHISLLMLCPTFVLGGKWLLKREWALLFILIPYFIFSSGIPFELAKYPQTQFLNIPYSHALSAQRIDTTGIYTKCDESTRNWIRDNTKGDIYADIWGQVFLIEVVGDKAYHLPWIPNEAPKEAYVYFRERNENKQELTYWRGIGTRHIRSYKEVGVEDLLEGRKVIYKCGSSKIYGPKGD